MVNKLEFEVFDYKDVRLVPGRCIVKSRSEIDVSAKLGHRTFKLPVIPANMSTIIDEKLAEVLAKDGYFYVMHRFDVDPVEFVENFNKKGLFTSISLGIQKVDYEHIDNLAAKGLSPNYITVDVAHGYSDSVIDVVKYIKEKLPNSFVIAGNVGTPEGALALEAAGADAAKTGIGPGSMCLTSPNTGFGTRDWQLSAVYEISKVLTKAVVIADGGIKEYGDIAKSIAFGADFIMIGGMFSGHTESPGEVFTNPDGSKVKAFFGSASEHQKGEKKNVEGKKELVPYKGPISETLRTFKENLQSSVSYVGGDKLLDLRSADYVLVK